MDRGWEKVCVLTEMSLFFLSQIDNFNKWKFLQRIDSLINILVQWFQRFQKDQKQKRNLLSKVFNLFEIFEITEHEFLLDCLFSARISFIESIYSRKEKQRYFCQDTYFLSPPIRSVLFTLRGIRTTLTWCPLSGRLLRRQNELGSLSHCVR